MSDVSNKNKDISSMIKDAIILFIITIVAGLLLGFVNDITKDPIARQQAKAKAEACKSVFAAADSFENWEDGPTSYFMGDYQGKVDIDEVMRALDASGNLLGYVITVTDHEGYGGDIQFSMGITLDGNLNGISILKISETAGLGMKAGTVLVPQFENKKADIFVYTKAGAVNDNEIDAISGATITTNAVVNGVNAGISLFKGVLLGEKGGNQ